MRRNANLSGAEKKAIDVLAAKNYSTRPIAKSTNRGKISVACYLQNKQVVRVNDHRRRPHKLSERIRGAVVWKAKSEKKDNAARIEELGRQFVPPYCTEDLR